MARFLEPCHIGFNQFVIRAKLNLVITVVQDHDLFCLVDEETRIRIGGFESEVGHSFAQMLVKQFGAVELSIETFLQMEHDIPAFTAFGSIVLRKLHKDVSLLRTLAECVAEINLSGRPSMGGSDQQAGSDCGPTHQG